MVPKHGGLRGTEGVEGAAVVPEDRSRWETGAVLEEVSYEVMDIRSQTGFGSGSWYPGGTVMGFPGGSHRCWDPVWASMDDFLNKPERLSFAFLGSSEVATVTPTQSLTRIFVCSSDRIEFCVRNSGSSWTSLRGGTWFR